jgi:hypothetical protein
MKTLSKIIFPVLIMAVVVIISAKSNTAADVHTTNKSATALTLNGSSTYFSKPYSKELITGKSITLEAWVKANNNDEHSGIIERSSEGSYTYRLYMQNNELTFAVNTGKDYVLKTKIEKPAEWNHIAASYNSYTGKMKIYLNGVLSASIDKAPAEILDFGSDTLYVGRSGKQYGSDTFFSGEISDVRVWTNSERIASEINDNMHAKLDSKEGLVVIRFDELTKEGLSAKPSLSAFLPGYYAESPIPWNSLLKN